MDPFFYFKPTRLLVNARLYGSSFLWQWAQPT